MIWIRTAIIVAHVIIGSWCSHEQVCRLLQELLALCVWLWDTKNTGDSQLRCRISVQVHPVPGGAVCGRVSSQKLREGDGALVGDLTLCASKSVKVRNLCEPAVGMCVWCRRPTRRQILSSVPSALKWKVSLSPTPLTWSLVSGMWLIMFSPLRCISAFLSPTVWLWFFQSLESFSLYFFLAGWSFFLCADKYGCHAKTSAVTLSWGEALLLHNTLVTRARAEG